MLFRSSGRLERLGVHECNSLKELAKLAGCVAHRRDWGGCHLSTGKKQVGGQDKDTPGNVNPGWRQKREVVSSGVSDTLTTMIPHVWV